MVKKRYRRDASNDDHHCDGAAEHSAHSRRLRIFRPCASTPAAAMPAASKPAAATPAAAMPTEATPAAATPPTAIPSPSSDKPSWAAYIRSKEMMGITVLSGKPLQPGDAEDHWTEAEAPCGSCAGRSMEECACREKKFVLRSVIPDLNQPAGEADGLMRFQVVRSSRERGSQVEVSGFRGIDLEVMRKLVPCGSSSSSSSSSSKVVSASSRAIIQRLRQGKC
ncbi:hypothetical protein CLOM_g13619 [Closterium sp. NIES-68]|nr:hypothetical protein CLOM_g13619 [Closterium sp. NIES-68]GJP77112.1 hypothetical protein CLOP_g7551 [Closterium sp. NIES-67]